MSTRTLSPDLVASLKRLRLGGLIPTLVERFTLAENACAGRRRSLRSVEGDRLDRHRDHQDRPS